MAGVVGAPVRNTWIGVVDAFGRPAPADAPGELAIGGDGLAEGYWERFLRRLGLGHTFILAGAAVNTEIGRHSQQGQKFPRHGGR